MAVHDVNRGDGWGLSKALCSLDGRVWGLSGYLYKCVFERRYEGRTWVGMRLNGTACMSIAGRGHIFFWRRSCKPAALLSQQVPLKMPELRVRRFISEQGLVLLLLLRHSANS